MLLSGMKRTTLDSEEVEIKDEGDNDDGAMAASA